MRLYSTIGFAVLFTGPLSSLFAQVTFPIRPPRVRHRQTLRLYLFRRLNLATQHHFRFQGPRAQVRLLVQRTESRSNFIR